MSANANTNLEPQSSSASRTSSPPVLPLQRGKACISCRRRKMKCDGARPICTPCLRGERAEDCEYTDGQRRSRTLALEEDLARLRARVQELENPEEAAPSIELYAPYGGPSTTGSASTGHAQTQAAVAAYASSISQGSSYGHPSADPLLVDPHADQYSRRALSVIAPYAAELGLFLDLDRLRVQGTHVLPALQSALTLWSVHIAANPDHVPTLEALKSKLLSQAQAQLTSTLSTVDAEPDPAISLHMIQAGVLLAYYMQRVGQAVGARYYASGTWAVGMMLKLYRGAQLAGVAGDEERRQSLQRGGAQEQSTHGRGVCAFAFADSARLAQPLDDVEVEERVGAFWAMYALDRWFSAVGKSPCQLLPMNAMTVPWPDVGPTDEARNVILHLLNNPNHDFRQDGPSAMQAKASVLLGESKAVAASYEADRGIGQTSAFQERFGTLDTLLQRCFNVAMAVATTRQPQTREHAQAMVTVHLTVLAHASLHRPFISASYEPSQRRCAEMVVSLVQVLDRVGAVETKGVSPIYATVWTVLGLALHEILRRVRAQPGADPARRRETDMVGAIRKLAGLLSALSQHCPSRFFAAKIEAVLSILESTTV